MLSKRYESTIDLPLHNCQIKAFYFETTPHTLSDNVNIK